MPMPLKNTSCYPSASPSVLSHFDFRLLSGRISDSFAEYGLTFGFFSSVYEPTETSEFNSRQRKSIIKKKIRKQPVAHHPEILSQICSPSRIHAGTVQRKCQKDVRRNDVMNPRKRAAPRLIILKARRHTDAHMPSRRDLSRGTTDAPCRCRRTR